MTSEIKPSFFWTSISMLVTSRKRKRFNGQWKSQKIRTSTDLHPLGTFCSRRSVCNIDQCVCIFATYCRIRAIGASPKWQRAKSTWHVRRTRETSRALLYTDVSKTDRDTSWEEFAKREKKDAKMKKKTSIQRREAKEQTRTQRAKHEKKSRETRSEFADNWKCRAGQCT